MIELQETTSSTSYEDFLKEALEEKKKQLEQLNQMLQKAGAFRKQMIKRQIKELGVNIDLMSKDLGKYGQGLRWLREPTKERDEKAEHLEPVPPDAIPKVASTPATQIPGVRPAVAAPVARVGSPVASTVRVGTPIGSAPRVGTPVGTPPPRPAPTPTTPIGKPATEPSAAPAPPKPQPTPIQRIGTQVGQPSSTQKPPPEAAPSEPQASTPVIPSQGTKIAEKRNEGDKKEEDTAESSTKSSDSSSGSSIADEQSSP